MKRMYVILGVFLLALMWGFSSFSQKQDPQLDHMQKQMQLREELHRKMIENLFHGTHDDQLFKDMEKLMDDAMKDSFGPGGPGTSSFSYSFGAQNFDTEWQESAAGRTLYITPQSKDQKLDINVQKDMVTIKGKAETKTPNGTSVSDFQNSFSIPEDCDSSKVKMDQKSGKIVMFFPWKTMKKVAPKKDERIPLPKAEDEVTI